MLLLITQTVKTCPVKKAAATTMANAPHIIAIPVILINMNAGTTTITILPTTHVKHTILAY